VKVIVFCFGVGPSFISGFPVQWRVSAVFAALLILSLWSSYKLQSKLDTGDVSMRVLDSSLFKITIGVERGYLISSELILRFENTSGRDVLIRFIRCELIHRRWLREQLVPTTELLNTFIDKGTLVKTADIPLSKPITELICWMRHLLPEGINPSMLDTHYSLRFTLGLIGRADQVVEQPVNWSKAIRVLDPDNAPRRFI
jgi:hypothetical protein